MSYAICQVVYGVPVTERLSSLVDEEEFEDMGDLRDLGFEMLYSGSANYSPGYCGVPIFEFDECDDLTKWSDFTAKVNVLTEEQKSEALEQFNALDPKILEALKEDGIEGPDIYLIWHSS